MIVSDYINDAIPYLKFSDVLQKGIDWMEEFKLDTLPLVSENGEYLGMVEENHLLEQYDWGRNLEVGDLIGKDLKVSGNDHVFEAYKFVELHSYPIVPVVDNDIYEGVLTMSELIKSFSEILNASQIGGILVLRMNARDYSLSELSRLAELNSIKVLSSSVVSTADVHKVDVLLKFNTAEIGALISSYERHDYNIIFRNFKSGEIDSTKENLDHLFRYLDV